MERPAQAAGELLAGGVALSRFVASAPAGLAKGVGRLALELAFDGEFALHLVETGDELCEVGIAGDGGIERERRPGVPRLVLTADGGSLAGSGGSIPDAVGAVADHRVADEDPV